MEKLEILDLDAKKKIAEYEKNIEEVQVNGRKLHVYTAGVEDSLRKLVPKQFAILSSDFEGILKKAGYSENFTEARQEFPKSKVLQGRYVASKIDVLPEEIKKIIDEVIKLTKK
jgi:hypothetical protein